MAEPRGVVNDLRSMVSEQLMGRIRDFIECEGRSCSFDPELITPEYVYRMWGGAVAVNYYMATGLKEL